MFRCKNLISLIPVICENEITLKILIMKKTFLFLSLVLSLSLFFVSCEREISFENGSVPGVITGGGSASGSARYSFDDGGTTSCTGAILSGTFKAGTATTAANTITLDVTVDTVGTWAVSSSTANGISFRGSGTFTSTGAQTIVLTATGTPTNAGDFNFTAGSAGCMFSVTVQPASVVNTTDYIRCTIDGINKTFNDGALAVNIFGIVLINGSENAAAANTGNFTITLSNTNIDSALSFTPGVFLNVTPLPGKTCLIGYIPDASSTDTTAYASATAGQPGAFTVTVTSVATNRIQGTFSGTLYDNDGNGSATKVVTNGEFSVPQ
jgi:hypothetical protein